MLYILNNFPDNFKGEIEKGLETQPLILNPRSAVRGEFCSYRSQVSGLSLATDCLQLWLLVCGVSVVLPFSPHMDDWAVWESVPESPQHGVLHWKISLHWSGFDVKPGYTQLQRWCLLHGWAILSVKALSQNDEQKMNLWRVLGP